MAERIRKIKRLEKVKQQSKQKVYHKLRMPLRKTKIVS